ncbi:hypothetical protein A2778_05745 [Candidatus Daviesbacteria bacterium RIFCSPHIGHO2_01_FULL_40_24]|uniref:Uncharacterized protein n=1 Tax=Candidatus Daviesbacteria bacterium GW2011_GWC2_40_12 TaxID=1618431 RepID=A0A0G0QZ98_9BACT|nr:MAG: hypothetical protein UT45_C0001G0059 [Candidatus Daviesbacteria bacterium GW2011_GWA2_39_33]KKR42761.1 MAG: hypothetical protein UT77_C0001G0212 [Candidatus Daviesbacteria bacterium GW2011_GWC2_40_12]KKT78744.1 MAG: hypothetical protein UW76_C0050G0002 [Parcubacteria group bacterium GW2011_GWF2_44_8b]OGE21656.1 MAG: hypothetical protein A2778_05745 [Candidatus Daviesbacteria bacterium RIFCSPHIGHO2_01_FULL_40_24]OGE30053.1 MAG: hypothetical protein A3C29_01450 [Candidatus Daviesbacteria 
MIKTETELLEEIYNSVHEEMLRMEIATETLADVDDDKIIETVTRRSPLGTREEQLTKKDVIARYTEDISKREKVLKVIKQLLAEKA